MSGKRVGDQASNDDAKKMKIEEFDVQDDSLYDVCLVVQDRKFYYSKQHLAFHSDYFKTMHFGDFKEKTMKEIVLNDPEQPGDFHKFLLIINGLGVNGTDEEVTRVMSLSKKWMADIPYNACLHHLLKSTRSSLKEKFDLATIYGLDVYKGTLIARVSSVDELGTIIPADLTTLDEYTRDKLFEKSLKLHGLPKLPPPPVVPVPINGVSYYQFLQLLPDDVQNYFQMLSGPDNIPPAQNEAQRQLQRNEAPRRIGDAQVVNQRPNHVLLAQQVAQRAAQALVEAQGQPQGQSPAQVNRQPRAERLANEDHRNAVPGAQQQA